MCIRDSLRASQQFLYRRLHRGVKLCTGRNSRSGGGGTDPADQVRAGFPHPLPQARRPAQTDGRSEIRHQAGEGRDRQGPRAGGEASRAGGAGHLPWRNGKIHHFNRRQLPLLRKGTDYGLSLIHI